MKTRSLFLTLTLGLVAGLFACQDVGVMAPDDLQPQFAKGGNKKPPPDPPTDGPKLYLTGVPGVPGVPEVPGVLGGDATEGGVSWSYKKGEFRGNAAQNAIIVTIDSDAVNFPSCEVLPEGSSVGDDLKAELQNGLSGISAILRADTATPEAPSEVNRITSYVGGEVVRYFWVGHLGEFASQFEGTGVTDATVKNFTDTWDAADGKITYELTGGVLGVRGIGSPSSAVQLACPNNGSVVVKLTKITS